MSLQWPAVRDAPNEGLNPGLSQANAQYNVPLEADREARLLVTRFRILGHVEVEGDTGPIIIRGARRRALLVRLLLTPNELTPADRIAEDLWDGSPPPGAASTLTSHVSLLRQLLGGDRIANRSGSYTLRVDPGELDTVEFASDLADAHAALRQNDPQRAVGLFERGLRHWRGSPLADVDGASWAQGEVARLSELRLSAEESLLEAQMALGHHREAVAVAEAAVTTEPLREQRWATLMLALYRSGRQADALRAYQRLRELLGDQLGLEPSAQLAALEEAIILHRPELDWARPVPPSPRSIPPVVPFGSSATDEGPVPPADADPSTPGTAGTVPLPEVLSTPIAGFVGRMTELERLTELTAEAVAGERRLVLLGGEPGIGKTTLMAKVAQAAHESGAVVLYGRCLEVGAPYQPFVEALGHLVRHSPDPEIEAHVAEFGGELARLVPALGLRVPGLRPPSSSDPEAERYLAFTAARGLLVGTTTHRPVLLVIDDLHWADESTLQLLRHVVSSIRNDSLMIVGAFRSNEVGPAAPLADTLAALWREVGSFRVELTGLSRNDVLTLCASLAGDTAVDEEFVTFATELQRDTAGNPFFVWEMLRHLVESGELVQDEAHRWSAAPVRFRRGLPPSLREVIAQRVQHVGPVAQELLTVAAVIGAEFDVPTLCRASGRDADEVVDLLEAAGRAALLTDTGVGAMITFAHALIRNTLIDVLQPVRRRHLHARVAAALEETAGTPSPALLAYHYAEAGERAAALHYAELAGYDALSSMAPDDAAHWFTEALALLALVLPDERLRRCDLTTQLGVAQLRSGDPAHRQTLLDAVDQAEAADDAGRMSVAALANSRGFFSAAGTVDHQRVAALRRSIDRLGDGDGPLRARLLAALCCEMVFDASYADLRAVAEQAKEEAMALDDPATVVNVINLVAEALQHPSLINERVVDTALALELAEGLGDPAAQFWATGNRMRILVKAGRVPEGFVLFARMAAVADEVGQPAMLWMSRFTRAHWAFLHGAHEEGERLAEEALAFGLSVGQPDALSHYASQISHARWQQGRLGELVEFIDEGARNNPGMPAYYSALARALCQGGRHDEAGAILDRFATEGFANLPDDNLWLYGMTNFAEVAVRLDRRDAAELLYDRLSPYPGQMVSIGTVCEGPVAHFLGGLAGVLGRYHDAHQHLERAAVLADDSGSPFYRARTLIEQGRVSARQGRDDARRLLADGAALAAEWGFAGELRRARDARDLLDRTGQAP